MSRPFPLAAVARLRRIRTEQSRLEVARSQAAERLADVSRADAQTALAGQTAGDARTESFSSAGFITVAQARLRCAHDVEVAQQRWEQATVVSRRALDGWQVARTNERVTDTLEAAHRASVVTEELAIEQRVADDRAGSAVFAARKVAAS